MIVLYVFSHYRSSPNKNGSYTPPTTFPSTAASANNNQQNNTTTGYIIYPSITLGIAFSYPTGWNVKDNSSTIIVTNEQGNSITLSQYPPKTAETSLTAYLTTLHPQSISVKDLGKTSQGYEMAQIDYSYYISNGQQVIQLSTSSKVDSNIVNQMLSSISFN